MPSSDFIIDVGEVDFEYEVLFYSKSMPVLVYFWADWCKPCKSVEAALERIVRESGGGFRLARVDSDANPNLAIRYEVRTLPTIKAIVDGEVSGSLIGPQPDSRIGAFIHSIAPPSQFIFDVEKANGYLDQKLWEKAEAAFRKVLEEEADNTAALLGLVKALLGQGNRVGAREALNILEVFPASREYVSAEIMRPLAEELGYLDQADPSDELFPAYRNALALLAKGKTAIALDGLLDILRTDRAYRRGKVRQVVLGILELMGPDDPQSRSYRAELASILF